MNTTRFSKEKDPKSSRRGICRRDKPENINSTPKKLNYYVSRVEKDAIKATKDSYIRFSYKFIEEMTQMQKINDVKEEEPIQRENWGRIQGMDS